jgi:4-amino-4-deoxy-L-arabinose transferase-like glycosyltransferase
MDSGIRTWSIVSIAVLFFFLIPGINHGLWLSDEPRVAGTCSEMARTHDYVVPSLNGQPFLEKPPLYYAAAAIAGSLLGTDKDLPYRLVSLLFGVLTIIITYLTVSRKDGPLMGMIAGGMLASTWEIFMLSRWIQVDIALVFGVTLAMFAYLRWLDTSSVIDSIILGLATGIAFMSKGLVGPAIIAAAIITDMIRRRDIKVAWRIRPFLVVAFMLLMVLPWIIALWHRGGWPFLRVAFVVNNLMRFTGAEEGAALGHQNGHLYYFQAFPGGIAPWTLVFIPAFISSVRNFKGDRYISWLLGPFILLSIASTQRGIYLAPLYPAGACMMAVWLEKARRLKWEDLLVKTTWAVSIAACFAPFAGIFLGLPVLGSCMGLLSVGSLVLVTRRGVKQREAISLVLVTCIALFSLETVYYQYMKPNKDFLDFTQRAVVAAGDKEITMISPPETLRGVLSLVTGKINKVVHSPSDLKSEGVYIWDDKDNRILNVLKKQFKVEMLLEKKLDNKGAKTTRIAYIIPISAGKNP